MLCSARVQAFLAGNAELGAWRRFLSARYRVAHDNLAQRDGNSTFGHRF